MSNNDELREHCTAILRLLDDAEAGAGTTSWHRMVHERIDKIAAFHRDGTKLVGTSSPAREQKMTEPVSKAVEAFAVYAADADKATTPLSSLQARLARWQGVNFGAVGLEQQALGVAEESGELCHAVLKSMQKIRGFDNRDKLREAAGDAIADCTIYLMQAATGLRLDFETLLKLTAERVMERNWVKNPNDADVKAAADRAGEPSQVLR